MYVADISITFSTHARVQLLSVHTTRPHFTRWVAPIAHTAVSCELACDSKHRPPQPFEHCPGSASAARMADERRIGRARSRHASLLVAADTSESASSRPATAAPRKSHPEGWLCSGGGGNRTRVHNRAELSIYERSLQYILARCLPRRPASTGHPHPEVSLPRRCSLPVWQAR